MELDIDGLSLDWRDDLRAYRASHGKRLALQGNLDPTFMHGSTEAAVSAAEAVLEAAGDAPGYIFNLGHGFAQAPALNALKPFFAPWRGGDAPAHDRSCSPRTGPHL